MRWDGGIYVLDDGRDPVVETLLNADVDTLFLELLALFTVQDQSIGIATGTNYAHASQDGQTSKGQRLSQRAICGGLNAAVA